MLPATVDCGAYLQAEAGRIHQNVTSLAVPIGRICYQHGLSIERSDSVTRFRAYMSLPIEPGGWARMALPEAVGGSIWTTPFERFCVAHELGHLLVFRRFASKPEGHVQYWEHEVLCDEFARTLLIPKIFVTEEGVDGSLHWVRTLARSARVPVMQAARRITELNPELCFLRISLGGDSGATIAASSLSSGRERGRKLKGLLRVLAERSRDEGRLIRRSVSGSSLLSSGLKTFEADRKFDVDVAPTSRSQEALLSLRAH